MTPGQLAVLYAAAFPQSRGWTPDEFRHLISQPGAILTCDGTAGFALGRIIVDEAELLTLAVAPKARRAGIGRRLLSGFVTDARKQGANRAFLEVAADNQAALALYTQSGWRESGRRLAYYARDPGPACDAILFTKHLT